MAFAQQGYRVIIPDLRGHGESTGEWISFGAEEGQDISAFVDQLAIEQFDIMGFSLGGSTALHLAAIDSRVRQIVVVAPMHSLEQSIPKFAGQSPEWLASIILNRKASALAMVDGLSGYHYEQTSDTMAAVQHVKQPVLFVYGSVDKMSNGELNLRLFEQSSTDSKLHKLEGLRHTHVLLHQTALMAPINQWLGIDNTAKPLKIEPSCALIDINI